MSFHFLEHHDNAIGMRVYPLLQKAYNIIHQEPALAGLRIRQALEEIGRYRMWTKHGYPLREDNEPYTIHKQAHSIYQRISSLLHIETIDPFDEEMVRRTARLQLRRIHALTAQLYPKKGARYIPPSNKSKTDQTISDFEDIQEEIDDLDDLLCGEEAYFVRMSDEDFEQKKSDLTQEIKQNKSLENWQRNLLLFELDLVQVGWDMRKKQYEEILPKDVTRRIEELLVSGQPQALPTIYEYYRRRQESAVNDFFFEKAYEESKALLERLERKQDNLSELNLTNIRNPLRGRVLSTYARIVAIHAHSYEDVAELDRARTLFEEAEAEFVNSEARAQQKLFIIHTLLEKKRIAPSLSIDTELDSLLIDIDKMIALFIEERLPSEIFRIDLRIACRLKVALIRKEKYNHLSRLSSRIAQELSTTEDHLHHPWEQICGLIYTLQPHNTPKVIKNLLLRFAAITPDTEESLLGMTARGYLLEGEYQKGTIIRAQQQQKFIENLPPDAQVWWKQYDIGSRFASRCAKETAGSPLDIFPFDMV